MSTPQHINSHTPFVSTARLYFSSGWNPVPLPEAKKKSPPEGFSGRSGALVDEDQLDEWLSDSEWAKGNIAVRPGNIITLNGVEYNALGIDIDGYGEKHGFAHLQQLEAEYGKLPATYISSARVDGISGIRWFLVPAGYEYMGKPRIKDSDGRIKASDSIEIVQKHHRYGVVWPSWHPETKSQYYWYDRGDMPDGISMMSGIPNAKSLALLPEKWFLFLSNNGIKDVGLSPIDMQITQDQLKAWADKNFPEPDNFCECMGRIAAKHCEKIDNGTDHHDPIVAAHWSLYHLAVEGHTGWKAAVQCVDSAWVDKVVADRVRKGTIDMGAELNRSREGALRKIKGLYDEYREKGSEFLEKVDPCTDTVPGKVKDPTLSGGVAGASESYERNDDGNAQHFLDLYGDRVRFVPNHPESREGVWLVFDEDNKKWRQDVAGVEMRTMFRQMKIKQQRDADRLLQAALASGNQVGQKQAEAWIKFALDNGNRAKVSSGLSQASSFRGVPLLFEHMDANNWLLPVDNGIIRFYSKGERQAGKPAFEFLDDADTVKEYFVTQNTNVPYIPMAEQEVHQDPEIRTNFKVFKRFMKLFLYDQMEHESYLWMMKLLGLSILGINIKKAIFLAGQRDTGKSTFQTMMAASLGDLSIWREPKIFEDTPFKNALAEALPRRTCMVGELGGKHIDAGLFKRITGGDEVSCELKNVNKPLTMVSKCTIISGCNDAPKVSGVDDATRERFAVIPFRHQIPNDEKDPDAAQELMQQCKIPMLAWLIEGCAKALWEGLGEIPAELALEKSAFVSELDNVGAFINETLVRLPDSEFKKYQIKTDQPDDLNNLGRMPDDLCIGYRGMFAAWEQWAKANNYKVGTSNALTKKLKDNGLIQDGSKNKDGELRWLGVSYAADFHRVNRSSE